MANASEGGARQLVKLREFSTQLAQRLKEAPDLPTEPTRLALRVGSENFLVEMGLAGEIVALAEERQHFWSALHIDDRPCGGCALYEFEAMGIAGVKIVGRDNALEKKIKDVKFMRQLLTVLREPQPDKKAFREYSRKLYQEQYKWPCLIFKCYYPSVLMDSQG